MAAKAKSVDTPSIVLWIILISPTLFKKNSGYVIIKYAVLYFVICFFTIIQNIHHENHSTHWIGNIQCYQS